MVALPHPRSEPKRSAFARLVFWFDNWLRRFQSVFEYSASPRCVFRAQLDHSTRPYTFASGTHFPSGARIVNLHFWNEQIPVLSTQSSGLGWALHVQRSVTFSLSELARYLASRPQFADIAAVRIIVTIVTSERTNQIHRMLARLGFEALPAETPGWYDPILQFAENIYVTLLVLAQNPNSVRSDTLRRQRTELLLRRDELDRRYGDGLPLCKSTEPLRL